MTIGQVFIGKLGQKRKIVDISDDSVTFIITDIGTKPMSRFKLMQAYPVSIQEFTDWIHEETIQ